MQVRALRLCTAIAGECAGALHCQVEGNGIVVTPCVAGLNPLAEVQGPFQTGACFAGEHCPHKHGRLEWALHGVAWTL